MGIGNIVLDMGCAGVANGLSTALLNPSDVVKLRLQSPGGAALYSGVGDCARKISAEQGIASLWTTALAATLLREALYSTTPAWGYTLTSSKCWESITAWAARSSPVRSRVVSGLSSAIRLMWSRLASWQRLEQSERTVVAACRPSADVAQHCRRAACCGRRGNRYARRDAECGARHADGRLAASLVRSQQASAT